MRRYFVDSSGAFQGECLADNPVNPQGFTIVELDAVPLDTRFIRFRDGAIVPADPFADTNSNFAAALAVYIEDKPVVTQNTVNALIATPRDGLTLSYCRSTKGAVGVVVDMIKNEGYLPAGTALIALKQLLADAKQAGVLVCGHLKSDHAAELAALYVELGIALHAFPDGTSFAVYEPQA